MRRKNLAGIILSMFVILFSTSAQAASSYEGNEDTDTRFVNARVVEITDARLSIIAQTGVEHVIAINREKTRVMVDGRRVSLKDVREGDTITIELDEDNPVKFAVNISMRSEQTAVARNRR